MLKGSIIHRALNVISLKKKANECYQCSPLEKGYGTFFKYVFAWVFAALSYDIAYISWLIYFVFILEFRKGKLFNIGLVTFLLLSVNIHFTLHSGYVYFFKWSKYSFIVYDRVV